VWIKIIILANIYTVSFWTWLVKIRCETFHLWCSCWHSKSCRFNTLDFGFFTLGICNLYVCFYSLLFLVIVKILTEGKHWFEKCIPLCRGIMVGVLRWVDINCFACRSLVFVIFLTLLYFNECIILSQIFFFALALLYLSFSEHVLYIMCNKQL
jgi:hypothetical protein